MPYSAYAMAVTVNTMPPVTSTPLLLFDNHNQTGTPMKMAAARTKAPVEFKKLCGFITSMRRANTAIRLKNKIIINIVTPRTTHYETRRYGGQCRGLIGRFCQ